MISWFKKKFSKENWRLVKTIPIDCKFEGRPGHVYYHLFESEKGNRKVEIASSFQDPYLKLDISAKSFDIYQTKIYRWEMGRYDPEIPRYSEIPEEETIAALKGSTN